MLALSLFLRAHGYAAVGERDLWGRALLVNAGVVPFETAATAFPPLPQMVAVSVNWLLPGLGPLALSLLVALLAAWLVTTWFVMLRKAKFGLAASLAVTALLAFNPIFVRAVTEGTGGVLVLLGVWLLALGIFNLRRSYRVNDIMLVSIALVVLAFSHPFGAVLAIASIPFLALVAPPDLLERSPISVFLVLLFPLAFSVLSFIFVNWILAGDAFHFLARAAANVASMSDRSGAVFPPNMLVVAALAAAGTLVAAPITIVMAMQARTLQPLLLATIGLCAMLVSAIVFAALLGVAPPLALALGPAAVIAAACTVYWPDSRLHRRAIMLWLVAGFFGATVILVGDASPQTRQWLSAALGAEQGRMEEENALLARLLADSRDILLDAEAAGAVVAMRGSADGLLSADAFAVRIASTRREMTWPVVVVRNAASALGMDKVGRAFPELFEKGAPGYRMVFDGPTWRAYRAIGEDRS
ncbi:hypothetical protein [Rhodobium gokarnense]|uniref:Glycosyltransferase RgtA/B/C/D-like domain-containing protein n=1 Tax=Rhodobium gokarnense TaxID=364296 RepID=A0ABT3HBD1_9HYPH|nr:hypothetical protein [Rhodobium gokarnense]MCW2307718.1 hypothetical protein [Rhodobium gokarnense]